MFFRMPLTLSLARPASPRLRRDKVGEGTAVDSGLPRLRGNGKLQLTYVGGFVITAGSGTRRCRGSRRGTNEVNFHYGGITQFGRSY